MPHCELPAISGISILLQVMTQSATSFFARTGTAESHSPNPRRIYRPVMGLKINVFEAFPLKTRQLTASDWWNWQNWTDAKSNETQIDTKIKLAVVAS